MIKIYLTAVLIFLTTLTIAVGVLKPGINKPVRFAANEFQITNTELAQNPNAIHEAPENTTKIVNTDLNHVKIIEKVLNTTSPKPKQTEKVLENTNNIKSKTIEVQKQPEKIKTSTRTVKTTPPQNTTKTVTTTASKPVQTNENITTAKIPQSVKNILNNQTQKTEPKASTAAQEPQKVTLPKIEPTQTPRQILENTAEETRPLTEQEEIIVWNIWRSNLQNQIMRDTQIAAPLGTAFKFSFTVDKKGRISNLRTWAVPDTYSSIAVNYLKPLILSYQGQPILNFPSRTKRVITNVTGGFVISTQDRFSTPNDFSDIEKVKTLR